MIGPTDLLHTSPASHLENLQVLLIHFPKCPSFSTIIPEQLIQARFGMLCADVHKLFNPTISRLRKLASRNIYPADLQNHILQKRLHPPVRLHDS